MAAVWRFLLVRNVADQSQTNSSYWISSEWNFVFTCCSTSSLQDLHLPGSDACQRSWSLWTKHQTGTQGHCQTQQNKTQTKDCNPSQCVILHFYMSCEEQKYQPQGVYYIDHMPKLFKISAILS